MTINPIIREEKRVSQKAKQALLQLLQTPEYAPGNQIPAERDLASFLQISRMTLRKAIEQLIEEGRLERRSNRGTFVTPIEVSRSMSHPQSLSRMLEISGSKAGSRLLSFQHQAANPFINQQLHIAKEAELVVIKRLRTVDDKPFCIETSYFPSQLLPGITEESIAAASSLYQLLFTQYGFIQGGDTGEIVCTELSDEDATHLGLPANSLALTYRGIIVDQAGKPIEYVVSQNHPQRVSFKIENSRYSK
ncbi:GntR family transcriptional regulator [Leeia sp. TBRC 13508]|uniref:GntR family transcriptional regulator n=1 Tax=Leeia speluncae TaxID=2884804 RepID=A0ABS8D8X2_9NEIS|nr:GntR family transcriptional regulator [Leeia speluncae]MCB6184572.1 GntR family transcriptional regulator [Leeia speluncae]